MKDGTRVIVNETLAVWRGAIRAGEPPAARQPLIGPIMQTWGSHAGLQLDRVPCAWHEQNVHVIFHVY
jgi:hypothetical protein